MEFAATCCDSLYWNLQRCGRSTAELCWYLQRFRNPYNGIGRYLQHFGRCAVFICHILGKLLHWVAVQICRYLQNIEWVTLGHSYIGISLIFAAFQTSNDIFALGLVHALQKYPTEKRHERLHDEMHNKTQKPTRSCTCILETKPSIMTPKNAITNDQGHQKLHKHMQEEMHQKNQKTIKWKPKSTKYVSAMPL